MISESMMKWRVRRDSRCNTLEQEDIRRSLDILDSVLAEYDDGGGGDTWSSFAADSWRERNGSTPNGRGEHNGNDFSKRRCVSSVCVSGVVEEAERPAFCTSESLQRFPPDGSTTQLTTFAEQASRKFSPPPVPKRSPATRLSSHENLFLYALENSAKAKDCSPKRRSLESSSSTTSTTSEPSADRPRNFVSESSDISPKSNGDVLPSSAWEAGPQSNRNSTAVISTDNNSVGEVSPPPHCYAVTSDEVFVTADVVANGIAVKNSISVSDVKDSSVTSESDMERSPSVAKRRANFEKLSRSETTTRKLKEEHASLSVDSESTSLPVTNSPFLKRKTLRSDGSEDDHRSPTSKTVREFLPKSPGVKKHGSDFQDEQSLSPPTSRSPAAEQGEEMVTLCDPNDRSSTSKADRGALPKSPTQTEVAGKQSGTPKRTDKALPPRSATLQDDGITSDQTAESASFETADGNSLQKYPREKTDGLEAQVSAEPTAKPPRTSAKSSPTDGTPSTKSSNAEQCVSSNGGLSNGVHSPSNDVEEPQNNAFGVELSPMQEDPAERIRRLDKKFAEVKAMVKNREITVLKTAPPRFVPPPPPKPPRKSREKTKLVESLNEAADSRTTSEAKALRVNEQTNLDDVSVVSLCNGRDEKVLPNTIEDLPKLLPTDTLNRPQLGLSYSMEDDLSPGVKEIRTSTPKSDYVPKSTFNESFSSLGYGSSQSDLDLNVSLKDGDKVPLSYLRSQTLPTGMKLGPEFYSPQTEAGGYDSFDGSQPEADEVAEEERGHFRSSSAPPFKHLEAADKKKGLFGIGRRDSKVKKNESNYSLKYELSLDEAVTLQRIETIEIGTAEQELKMRTGGPEGTSDEKKRRSVWKSILRRK